MDRALEWVLEPVRQALAQRAGSERLVETRLQAWEHPSMAGQRTAFPQIILVRLGFIFFAPDPRLNEAMQRPEIPKAVTDAVSSSKSNSTPESRSNPVDVDLDSVHLSFDLYRGLHIKNSGHASDGMDESSDGGEHVDGGHDPVYPTDPSAGDDTGGGGPTLLSGVQPEVVSVRVRYTNTAPEFPSFFSAFQGQTSTGPPFQARPFKEEEASEVPGPPQTHVRPAPHEKNSTRIYAQNAAEMAAITPGPRHFSL